MTATTDEATQPPPIFSAEVCQRAGVSYRQLDYWSRRGFIPETAKGSGVPRHFTEADIEYITTFAKLVHAGLDHERANAVMKLKLDQVKLGAVRLTDHIVLLFDEADHGHDVSNS